jgi:hypothetical protein
LSQHDQELAQAIKIKFGTTPDNPTTYQLEKIKQDLKALVAQGITPSERDWGEIVKKHCPETGKYFYKGLDNSDLTTLLQLATKK